MLRGDDVLELQRRLGALGFDTGRADGIFGPDTERALRDFQRNGGITVDGVSGRDTLEALERLGTPDAGTSSVMGVRERTSLELGRHELSEKRLAVGHAGGLDALVTTVARALRERGATVVVLDHPDPSTQAAEANRFRADAYVSVSLTPEPGCRAAYFSVPDFESIGGRRLAELVADALPTALDLPVGVAVGMRLPSLRETRMPAVDCRLGPPEAVVVHGAEVAATLADCLERWVEHPVQPASPVNEAEQRA
jgi:N-acetylmuramoyl-L-alanine amidase